MILTITLYIILHGYIIYMMSTDPDDHVKLTDDQMQDIAARLQAHRANKQKRRQQ